MSSALAKSCSVAIVLAALVFVGGCNRSGSSSSSSGSIQGVATASSISVVTATNAE